MLTLQFLLAGILGLAYWRLLYLFHKDIKSIRATLQEIQRVLSLRS